MTLTQRIKIGKIWNLIFHSFQNITHIFFSPDLLLIHSVRTQQKLKKKFEGGFVPPHPTCFRIENPTWNRLASTAYFPKQAMLSLLLLLSTVKHKIDHNSKTGKSQKKLRLQKLQSEHCTSFFFTQNQKNNTQNYWKLSIKLIILKKKLKFFSFVFR